MAVHRLRELSGGLGLVEKVPHFWNAQGLARERDPPQTIGYHFVQGGLLKALKGESSVRESVAESE
jgi:hypothetical protein